MLVTDPCNLPMLIFDPVDAHRDRENPGGEIKNDFGISIAVVSQTSGNGTCPVFADYDFAGNVIRLIIDLTAMSSDREEDQGQCEATAFQEESDDHEN